MVPWEIIGNKTLLQGLYILLKKTHMMSMRILCKEREELAKRAKVKIGGGEVREATLLRNIATDKSRSQAQEPQVCHGR